MGGEEKGGIERKESARASQETCLSIGAKWKVRGKLELPVEPEVARSPKSADAKECAIGVWAAQPTEGVRKQLMGETEGGNIGTPCRCGYVETGRRM